MRTRRAVAAGGASLPAACLLLLVSFSVSYLLPILAPSGGGQYAATAVAASASALALLAAVALCAYVLLVVGPTEAGRGAVVARSSTRAAAFLPQRDPDAAGKPRPRAPGSDNPPAV
jgi:hypothetical protein